MLCSLVSVYFDSPQLGLQYKQTAWNLRLFIQRYASLEVVSPSHFVYDFSRKMVLMLYSINWPNFIVWLPLLLEILGNMCIAIVYFPSFEVIIFETNLVFLMKPFFYMTKNPRQNILGKIKSIFYHFLRDFSRQKFLKHIFRNHLRWLLLLFLVVRANTPQTNEKQQSHNIFF